MFRFWAIGLSLSILCGSCFAQPPVELVGPTEHVCAAAENDLCSSLLKPHASASMGGLQGNAKVRPRGFESAYAVASHEDERGDGFYVFGQGQGASAGPYLAFAPKDGLQFPRSWEFFTGRGLSGSTNWVGADRWQTHSNAAGDWDPGARAKLFTSVGNCSGFQVEWNAQLGRWLMLYGCGGGTAVRVALHASGPWSDATVLTENEESPGPGLMVGLAGAGPFKLGSRTTIIYWNVIAGAAARPQIMRAVLRQEDEP
jgi:hypothetical protein